MTLKDLNSTRIIIDRSSKAWHLLERVETALESTGTNPKTINGIGLVVEMEKIQPGERYLGIKTVYRSNGTAEDVSVKITVYEATAKWSEKVAEIKVPKDASDKVVKNRIEKAISLL